MGGLDKRIDKLERGDGGKERSARIQAAKVRMLEDTAQDFERRVAKLSLKSTAEGPLDITELRRKPPVDIAATYVVLSQRGEREMAEAVRALYNDVLAERDKHPAARELAQQFPAMSRGYDKWFWEIVERCAQRR